MMMGVDKKDVGLVVHYDISSSLEDYVQEAGRAGRNPSINADCYVLYNDDDLNKHFILLNQTKLSFSEIQQIWNIHCSAKHKVEKKIIISGGSQMEIHEIFDMLAEGIDPTTGEVFDVSIFGQWNTYSSFKRLKDVVSAERKKTSKKGIYRKLCDEYPGHIVLIKSGFFYSAYNESAEVLGQAMGYKVAYINGTTPTTGGPDLCIIAEKLRAADLSYIAFNHGEIKDRFEGKNPFA